MSAEPHVVRLAHARHAFLRLAPPLPLAHDGRSLRTALREAGLTGQAELVQSWRSALETLHAAGFGTDDALNAARIPPTSPKAVAFDPHHVYPLGALARRPVAAWLDLNEAARWLADQGAREDLVALMGAPPPWPGWPEAPSPLFLLVGPPAECRALCEAVAIQSVDALALPALGWPPIDSAAHVLAAAHLRRLATGLSGQKPIAVLATGDETPLPLPAWPRVLAQTVGAPPPPAEAATAEAFGLEPIDRPEPPPPPTTARALEDARLFDLPAQRASAEARALIVAQVDAALRDLPPLPTDRAVDLARDGLDRAATQRAHLLRALLTAPLDPRRALADLTEARRIHKDERVAAVARGLHCVISHTLAIEPADGEASPLLSALADLFGRPTWDDTDVSRALTLAASAGLDLPELAPVLTELVSGLVIERLGRDAILDAQEEHLERLFGRWVATVALPPAVASLARAWAAVAAARRGATNSVRERLIQAAEALALSARSRRAAPPLRPLTRLAAERYALAARLAGHDGLVPLFLDAVDPLDEVPPSPLGRMLSGERPLHLEPRLPPWLATLALEGLTSPSADLGERRRAAPLLATQIEARPGCELALGAVFAGATLSAGKVMVSSPIDAPRARELLKRTAHGEPHHERLALSILAILPGGDADEREAIKRKLQALGRLALESDPRGAPLEPSDDSPFDPPSAERRVLRLVAELVRAAAHHAPYEGWCRMLTLALGEPRTEVAPASDATRGLSLVQDGEGWLLEPLSGAPPQRFAGPGHPVASTAPELVAKALSALAPLFVPRQPEATPSELDAEALDEALRSGALDFFGGLLPAFKRRELLLPTLRGAIDLGLTETRGLYRALANRWRIEDYQRFMDFLRRNDALLDYRPYRRGDR